MTRPVLHHGSRGKAVLAARRALAARGYRTEHARSEFWGQGMDRVFVRFQRHAGLDADGILGPQSWAALTHKPQHKHADPTTAEQFALTCKRRLTGRDGKTRPSYVFGAEADLTAPYPTRLDCSEAMQWGIYQTVRDVFVDGSFNQYPACKPLQVAKARSVVGALVFLTDDNTPTGTIHHVGVVCEEKGQPYVAQARSRFTDPECGIWPFAEQDWALAGLVPVLDYR